MNFIVAAAIGIESDLNCVMHNSTETITIEGLTENLKDSL